MHDNGDVSKKVRILHYKQQTVKYTTTRQKRTDDAVSVTNITIILKKIFGDEWIADANDIISFEAKSGRDFDSYCSEISETLLSTIMKEWTDIWNTTGWK